MKTFAQFIYEGLYVDKSGKLIHSDTRLPGQHEWVPTKDSQFRNRDGTYRTQGSLRGFPFFFGYGMEDTKADSFVYDGDDDKDTFAALDNKGKSEFISNVRKQFLDAIKHPEDPENRVIVQELVEKSKLRFQLYLRQVIGIRDIDFIITLPSNSNLNTAISSIIGEWYPDAEVLSGYLSKAKNKEVVVLKAPPTRNGAKLDPVLDKLRNRLKQPDNADREFKLTGEGGISPMHREFVSNFIVTTPGMEDALGKIAGKNVLLIDDTISVGTSVNDAARELKKYNPKNLFGYVFFNEKRSGWR